MWIIWYSVFYLSSYIVEMGILFSVTKFVFILKHSFVCNNIREQILKRSLGNKQLLGFFFLMIKPFRHSNSVFFLLHCFYYLKSLNTVNIYIQDLILSRLASRVLILYLSASSTRLWEKLYEEQSEFLNVIFRSIIVCQKKQHGNKDTTWLIYIERKPYNFLLLSLVFDAVYFFICFNYL